MLKRHMEAKHDIQIPLLTVLLEPGRDYFLLSVIAFTLQQGRLMVAKEIAISAYSKIFVFLDSTGNVK